MSKQNHFTDHDSPDAAGNDIPVSRINRNVKDRLFRFVFGNEKHKDWTLNLYNSLQGTHYTNPDDLELVSLDNAIYMHMRNDLSTLVALWYLSFFEHQASLNPNIPYRMLQYCAATYSNYVAKNDLNPYGRKAMVLPVPKFFVLYNGVEKAEKHTVLKLSDLYYNKDEEPMLELIVHQLNINGYEDKEGSCRQLYEYQWFVERIRENGKTMSVSEAVNKALDEIPEDFTIREFLLLNRSEVADMSIFEYNDERQARLFRREGYEDGFENGYKNGTEYGDLRRMTAMVLRTMKAKEIGFQEACASLLLNDEEIAACKEFMVQMNSETRDDQEV